MKQELDSFLSLLSGPVRKIVNAHFKRPNVMFEGEEVKVMYDEKKDRFLNLNQMRYFFADGVPKDDFQYAYCWYMKKVEEEREKQRELMIEKRKNKVAVQERIISIVIYHLLDLEYKKWSRSTEEKGGDGQKKDLALLQELMRKVEAIDVCSVYLNIASAFCKLI